MKVPNFQWQGTKGTRWWQLDAARDKFSDTENELIIKVSDNLQIRALVTKRQREVCWSEIHINNSFYEKSCENIDEDLYRLLDSLDELVFIQDTKKNIVEAISLKVFEKKKNKFLSKSNLKVFSVNEIF